ncbi:MAG: 6-carboxytetrahydropterin synthase QueD [Guyparkeria sp.]|uniref:6-carboxytetrahydropterin synthase QueD n=1 Tax=Guyparkeria sp. TaxID=2035736 RepID=UPI00397B43FB
MSTAYSLPSGGIYTLTTEVEFAAAHRLHGYDGNCARLHGHNWRVVIEVSGRQLDEVGMVVDFKVIRARAREIAKRLDHAYLNEVPPFDSVNPTAEHIAAYFHRSLAAGFDTDAYRVSAVTVWENDRSSATFRP